MYVNLCLKCDIMDVNERIRPRASTMPDHLLKKSKGAKQKEPNDKSSEKRRASYEKAHIDMPNGIRSPRPPTPELTSAKHGYPAEGPKRKPRIMSKMAAPESNGARSSPRRRVSIALPPNPTGLSKPVSNEVPKTRRKSCPSISPRSILTPTKTGSRARRIECLPAIYDSLQDAPKTVWDEIDETLEKPVDIYRDPLPGGSPEFNSCMTELETLDIRDEHPKRGHPRRLSAEWQPKVKVIQAEDPDSPRTPRRVRWRDVS